MQDGQSPYRTDRQTITSGNRSDIREIQQRLQDQGLYQGEVDGLMGPLTRQALTDYQERQELPATGRLDAATRRALGVGSTNEMQPVRGVRDTGTETDSRAFRTQSITRRGPAVRNAQQALQRQGFHRGAVDGMLGPVTRDSIRAFQQANDIEPTGRLDPATMRALGVNSGNRAQRGTAPGEREAMEPGLDRSTTSPRTTPHAAETRSPDDDRENVTPQD